METNHGNFIELSEADNLSKLVIIKNVFELFGVDSDIMEMAQTFSEIGSAYSSFFNEVEPIEIEGLEKIDKNTNTNTNEIREQLTQAYEDNKEEIETTYKERNDQPEFVRTGIKQDSDGTKRYRLHYKCVACWNKENHFVFFDSKKTWCHKCQHEMVVLPAHPEGFPNHDTFQNFFRAGEFYDWNLWRSESQPI
ncbi:hypothetical protein [Paenibacillus sp. FSL H7-0331]|uniref:hypothetical protein n=1 Tax=Paenibacillus sp. FSL H7-0331 TaxID=1920421 RepID=UPI00096D816E|nr:hypothetical protein [Paenibacillus sp. FSL H7-0331]OMF18476.1 hypothetical protein BK127_11995 [Paenibacillus sp. FSL H7-0331]